jgi:diadenosine tetraphosphate (Ap4A) HIT family hydrolase
MQFALHPNLSSKIFISDLPLCRVLLEDEQHYPWLFLVPRKASISKIMDLGTEDQLQLLKELDLAQNVLWKEFKPFQLNVAAIGNKTPQLHVHVIGRQMDDPAWPGTVWDHKVRKPYDPSQKESIVLRLKKAFSQS